VKRLLFLVVLVALLPSTVNAQTRIIEMGITAPEMAQYFQQHAGAQDIARVDHPNDIGFISGITVGKKMVIFKSASQIQQFLASNASDLDIIGYNLEPGQTHDANELANPVAAAKAVQAIARQYGKQVAIGLTRSLALQYGAAMAPYADIWVLQIQKAQNDPAMAGEFVSQMLPALQRANPSIVVFVQIRTDSSPAALAKLVNGLSGVHVSILTQRSDVQDAVNVAGAFFGSSGQAQAVAPNRQPRLYGDRLPSKDGKWLLPTPTLHLGSTDDDHVKRGSINSWDLVAPKGTPVYAARAGVVEAAGCNLYEYRQWPIMQGYGCAVSIKHGDGIVSQYGHCDTGSIVVKVGQQVDEWTLLCAVGMTGQTSFGPHTHFTILRNGSPIRIDSVFDVSRMLKYQRLGNAVSSEVPSQIGVVGGAMVTGQQQATVTTVTTSKGQQLLQALASLPAEQFALLVSIVLGSLMFTWWLSGTYVRVVILATVTTVIVGGCIALLFMPTQIQATQTSQPVAVGGDWEKSYEITQGREGWKCTNDGAYTMGGVTQGTYNRWLAKHGKGKADVCQALTREQAKQIFYELFWLPVGADKMPFALALTVVDHYYNTGKVSHLLAQCGQDVVCFNQARIADYKTKSNCNLYCKAWIARVNHLRSLTEGSGS
jgi:murein DD-endopeptidase MepM/ murein hydrolase activator NlpD